MKAATRNGGKSIPTTIVFDGPQASLWESPKVGIVVCASFQEITGGIER